MESNQLRLREHQNLRQLLTGGNQALATKRSLQLFHKGSSKRRNIFWRRSYPGRIPGIEHLFVIWNEIFCNIKNSFWEKFSLLVGGGGPLLKLSMPIELPDWFLKVGRIGTLKVPNLSFKGGRDRTFQINFDVIYLMRTIWVNWWRNFIRNNKVGLI